MRIPKPKPPIDVDDVLAARAAGESVAAYARRAGYSVGAVYDGPRRSRRSSTEVGSTEREVSRDH